MDQNSVIDQAEEAMISYENLRDELDPTLAYSWRSDSKTENLLDKTEKKLISIIEIIETASKVLRDELHKKKTSFQHKMNLLWEKIHSLEAKSENAGEEMQKFHKERITALKEKIDAVKKSEKLAIDSIELRIDQFDKDRTNIQSYRSEIRSKTK